MKTLCAMLPATMASIALAIGPALAQPVGDAGGTIDLSWNACAPLQSSLLDPAAGPVSLYVSVSGHSIAHQAYQVWFVASIGASNPTLPDAWRFDAAGCQGSSFVSIDHLAPATVARSCPSFQGNLPSLQIEAFQLAPPALGLPTTMGCGVLQNAYPAGNTVTTNPSARYFLARFLFDHSYSVAGATTPGVSCGGYDSPICISLVREKCSWLDLSGVEYRFRPGQAFVTVDHARARADCRGDGVQPATWGGLKGQYRR
jgi:hypothetical protein